MKRRKPKPEPPPTVRDTHTAYIATLTDQQLNGNNNDTIENYTSADYDTTRTSGYDTTCRLRWPTPQDLLTIIYDAEDQTAPTIGNDP